MSDEIKESRVIYLVLLVLVSISEVRQRLLFFMAQTASFPLFYQLLDSIDSEEPLDVTSICTTIRKLSIKGDRASHMEMIQALILYYAMNIDDNRPISPNNLNSGRISNLYQVKNKFGILSYPCDEMPEELLRLISQYLKRCSGSHH